MAKSPHGGTIFSRQFKSGKYLYYRKYGNRKIFSTSLKDTPNNRKIVEKILEKAYLDFIQGENQVIAPPKKRISYTIGELWEIYQKEFLLCKEKRTIESYKSSYKSLITNENIEPTAMQDVDYKTYTKLYLHIKSNIEELIKDKIVDGKIQKGLSTNTINIRVRSIQAFLNWLFENGYIPFQISLKKLKYETIEKKIHAYDEATLTKIAETLNKTDREFLLLLMLQAHLGLRISESLNLKWEQIEWKHRRIAMANKIKKTKIDYIPITKSVNELLLELKEISKKRNDPDKQLKVFRWEQISNSRLYKRLNKILNDNGLKIDGVAFHGFRKMFLTHLAQITINIVQFKQISRIKDLKIAEKYYIKQSIEEMINILETK